MKKETKTIRTFHSRGIYNRKEGGKPYYTKLRRVYGFFTMYGEEFAVHKNANTRGWTVSHAATGCWVCDGTTRNAVKTSAKKLLNNAGKEKVCQGIKTASNFIIAQKDNTDHEGNTTVFI